MTTLAYAEPELLIALNKKVIFVNPNDLQIFKEVALPEDLTKCGLQIPSNEDNNDNAGAGVEQTPEQQQQQQSKKTKPVQQEAPSILQVRLAPNRQILAVTTAGQKALLLYKCRPEHAKLVSVRPLARASSALAFNSDSTALLVTDKTGDCYRYDCVDFEAAPRLLLGHLSIVYDVLWTADEKYIITGDRDDKIRVTNYPATHDIHGYCLGHKEFVAGLEILQGQVLVSVSGDKTLRLWNFESGQQLASIELPAPGIRLAVRTLGEGKFQAAILLYQPNECVGIYEITASPEDKWNITACDLLSYPSMIVSNLCFAQERLFVAGIVDDHFTLKVAAIKDAPAAPENWLQMVDEQFQTDTWKPDDVSAWFKKRFDNVTDYLERKKRRIEQKQK